MNPALTATTTDEAATFTISSCYDLLHPDGINVVQQGSKLIINRPSGLSNLSKVNFRSLSGDLLPFTSIELPELRAELILMSNGLKTATILSQDTIDISGQQKYENTKHNVILSVNKAWSYDDSAENQVIANIEQIVDLMNKKLTDYLDVNEVTHYVILTREGELCQNFYTNDYTVWLNPDLSSLSFCTNDKRLVPIIKADDSLYFLDGNFSPSSVITCCSFLSSHVNTDETFYGPATLVCTQDNSTLTYQIALSRDNSTRALTFEEISGSFTVGTNDSLYDHVSSAASHLFFTWGLTNTLCNVVVYRGTNKLHLIVHTFSIGADSVTVTSSVEQDLDDDIFPFDGCRGIYVVGFNKWIEDETLYPEFKVIYESSTGALALCNIRCDLSSPNVITSINSVDCSYHGLLHNENFWQSAFGRFTRFGINYTALSPPSMTRNPDLSYFTFEGEDQMVTEFRTQIVIDDCAQDKRYARTLGDSYCFQEVDQTTLMDSTIFGMDEPSTDVVAEAMSNTKFYDTQGCLTCIQGMATSSAVIATPMTPGESFDVSQRDHYLNSDGLITTLDLGVKSTATDTSDNTVYLDPRNGDYLNTRVYKYLYISEPLTIDDQGQLSGKITIPQLEYASDYAVNFNLKIYTNPFMFELYTERDFDIEGNEYNFNINETNTRYYGISPDILTTLEQLILLRYNYNNVILRVSGFPNSDGVVFNLNEKSLVQFKSMMANATTQSLTVELISREYVNGIWSEEILSPEILQTLYGKITFDVDWVQ